MCPSVGLYGCDLINMRIHTLHELFNVDGSGQIQKLWTGTKAFYKEKLLTNKWNAVSNQETARMRKS